MRRVWQTVALMVVLSACQGLEYIGEEPVDPLTYRATVYEFTQGDVYFVHRLHEVEGQAAICGFLKLGPDQALFGRELVKKWFDSAKLKLSTRGGDTTDLGSGSFLMVQEASAKVYEGEARCVRSAVPWQDEFEHAVVKFEGPRKVTGRF